jgi:hypothetical protein
MDRRWIAAICGILVILAVTVLVRRWSIPPQIGSDEEVVKTVDALFTAITTRDLSRLEDCDQRLKSLHQSGRLPAKSAKALEGMIQQARGGQWEPAARRLYSFIYGQRGD